MRWLGHLTLVRMRRFGLPSSEFFKGLCLVGCLRSLPWLTMVALVQRGDGVLGWVHPSPKRISLLIRICRMYILDALSCNAKLCWFCTLLSKAGCSCPMCVAIRAYLRNIGRATMNIRNVRDNWRVITIFPVEWRELTTNIQVWRRYISNSTMRQVGISALFLGKWTRNEGIGFFVVVISWMFVVGVVTQEIEWFRWRRWKKHLCWWAREWVEWHRFLYGTWLPIMMMLDIVCVLMQCIIH